MRVLLSLVALLVGCISARPVAAACSPGAAWPFGCEAAVSISAGDLVLGGLMSGVQSGHTVKMTVGQIIAADHTSSPVTAGGTTATLGSWLGILANSTTGTGAIVLSTSPTLVTPNLGTPSALVLTNGTGLPLGTGVTGVLPVAHGGTGIGSGTSGGVLAFTGSGALASSGALTAHGVVVGGGAGAVPTSTSAGTAGQVLTSNGSSDPTFQVTKNSKGVMWCAACTVAAETMPIWVPQFAGTITSVTYLTGGSGTPSFGLSVTIAGTNVTSCNGLTVSSSSATTTTCTGANTFTAGQQINAVTGGISGSPASALVQLNYTVP